MIVKIDNDGYLDRDYIVSIAQNSYYAIIRVIKDGVELIFTSRWSTDQIYKSRMEGQE